MWGGEWGGKEGRGGGICWLCVPPAPLHVLPASPLSPYFKPPRNTAYSVCLSYLSLSPQRVTKITGPEWRGQKTLAAPPMPPTNRRRNAV